MSSRAVIGIDNGTTGTLALVGLYNPIFMKTPVKKGQDYTQKKKNRTRLDWEKVKAELENWQGMAAIHDTPIYAYVERPMVNPRMFDASVSAVRAFEAMTIVLESLGIGFEVVDSKEWQKAMLPAGTKGSAELKKASRDVGCRMFPNCVDTIKKHKDADALLLAEHYRRAHG